MFYCGKYQERYLLYIGMRIKEKLVGLTPALMCFSCYCQVLTTHGSLVYNTGQSYKGRLNKIQAMDTWLKYKNPTEGGFF